MDALLHTPRLDIDRMITRHQIIRLQEIIVELQHRLMYRETIERATFIRKGVDTPRIVSLEGIATALRCWTGRVFSFETVELIECV